VKARLWFVVVAALVAAASCSRPAAVHTTPAPPTTLPPVEVTSPPPALTGPLAAAPTRRYVPMWRHLDDAGPMFAFDTRLVGGGFGRMLVVADKTGADGSMWVRVQLPLRPNGRTAWVPGRDVRLVKLHDRIVVDLSARTLSRYRDGKLIDRFLVGVGRPAFPTAIGTFYVWQKVNFGEWYGPYGIYALGLSGFSPVLSDWPGGGRMAIHGTYNSADMGHRVSHGCIRVYNRQMKKLRTVPLGTPVIIKR
jgi:lipoprotein-anchoring transpeptidase ErfK/SrfK